MKKKFAAMFMAAAMVFTMAACGQKADTPDTPSTDGSGDQSGAEAQTIVHGTSGPLTGGSDDDRTWPAGLRRCRPPDCEAPPQTP